MFFVVCAIGWVGSFCINNLVNSTWDILRLDIVMLSIAFLLLIGTFVNANKTKKIKNLYGLSKYLFFLTFLVACGVIAGVFVLYYTGYALNLIYYLTISILILAYILAVLTFVISLKLNKLHKGTSIYIEDNGQIPNYDDELYLKKKLDELNRKKEMQKVVDQIESIK